MKSLQIKDLSASIGGKKIFSDLNLAVRPGEIVALMGPNGSGKSTLALALAGHPGYEVAGEVLLDGVDILKLKPHERARSGLFLAFQYPYAVAGLPIREFLRTAYNAIHAEATLSVLDFKAVLKAKLSEIGLDESFAERSLNDGFSGGEKKRSEILQLLVLEPKYAILDESDSGLDIDGLKIVTDSVRSSVLGGMGMLLITHYTKLLDYLKPDQVHVLAGGNIADSGGMELVSALEVSGYEQYRS